MPGAGCRPTQISGACCLYRCASYCLCIFSYKKEAIKHGRSRGEAKNEMKHSKLFKDVFYVRPFFFLSLTYYITLFIMNKQKVFWCMLKKCELNLSRKEERIKKGARTKEEGKGAVVICSTLGNK